MRFLVLLASVDHFDNWDASDAEVRERYFHDYRAFADAVRARGTLVAGDALQRPGCARTLQPGEARMITDGPFAETIEQLGGFYLIDVPDLDTAVAAAKLLPREYLVEVRPALGVPGLGS
jgi:hypothetical protein